MMTRSKVSFSGSAVAEAVVNGNLNIGPNKVTPRPHLGGHASCIRAGLTTNSFCQGQEIVSHSLMHAQVLALLLGGRILKGVSLQKKRIRLLQPQRCVKIHRTSGKSHSVISALSLPIRSGMNTGTRGGVSCGPWLVMPSAPLHRAS